MARKRTRNWLKSSQSGKYYFLDQQRSSQVLVRPWEGRQRTPLPVFQRCYLSSDDCQDRLWVRLQTAAGTDERHPKADADRVYLL